MFHQGERRGLDDGPFVLIQISIRAPAGGATLLPGCDNAVHGFQSALPQGNDRSAVRAVPERSYFNPRSRRGRDSSGFRGLKPRGISIRAPARGATKNETHNHPTEIISIRAPAGGATAILDIIIVIIISFLVTLTNYLIFLVRFRANHMMLQPLY